MSHLLPLAETLFVEMINGRDLPAAEVGRLADAAVSYARTFRAAAAKMTQAEATFHMNQAQKLTGCRACHGSGGKRAEPCTVCNGTGKVPPPQ